MASVREVNMERQRIEWLRAAAKEGFDDLERGDFVEFRSDDEIREYIARIRREVSGSRRDAAEN